jgi:hypothetical protein
MRSLFAVGTMLAGIGILVAGLSFSYYEVSVLPAEANARRERFDSCVRHAGEANTRRWARECSANINEMPSRLAACLRKASFEVDKDVRGLEVISCRQEFSPAPSGECRLPSAVANRFDHLHDEARQECLTEAQAHL